MLSPWMLPMAGLAWLAGTALQLQRAALWAPIGAWALLGAALACLLGGLIAGRSGTTDGSTAGSAAAWQRAAGLLLAIAAGAALGYAQTELRAHERLRDRLAPALERVDLLVTGVVADLPTRRSDGVRLRLQVESAQRLADGVAVRVPALVSLGWYLDVRAPADDAEPAFDPRAVRAGERWRLVVRLGAPHGLFNPGGFDYELWLFEQGVGASGTIRQRSGPAPRLLDAQAGYPLQRMRQAVRDAIHARLGDDSRAAGVVAALCVGDQAGIALDPIKRVLTWAYL